MTKFRIDFAPLICWGLIFLSVVPVSAQEQDRPFGTWRAYLTQSRGVEVVVRDNEVFNATTGGLLIYDRTTAETRVFTTIEGLHDIEAKTIALVEKTGQIFLGYEDGNIDYFTQPEQIEVLTDISRTTTYPDRQINQMASDDERLYVATNFGLVVYELETLRPLADAAQFGDNASNQPVTEVAVSAGRIFILLSNGRLFSASADFPNLRDPLAWREEAADLTFPEGADAIGATNFGMYMLSDTIVYQYQNEQWVKDETLSGNWSSLHASPDAIAVSRIGLSNVKLETGVIISNFVEGNIFDIAYAEGNEFYQTRQFRGLVQTKDGSNNLILPEGPENNDCVRIAAGNGEVYIAPRGYDQVFTPVILGNGVYHYSHNTSEWKRISRDTGLPDQVQNSFARAYYEPTSGQAYMGSWGSGMVVLKDGEYVEYFNCENSALTSTTGTCEPNSVFVTRVSGIEQDIVGNLWVSMDFGRPPLAVRSPDGVWQEIDRNKFLGEVHATDLTVDTYGNVWMVNFNRGVVVYTSNGTGFDYQDGRVLNLGTGLNQGSLPSDQVRSIATDRDGFIWVGTAKGVTVFYDPFTISTGQIVDGTEPIFEQAPLLSNTIINAIAVDGGNRKWFGTDDGVYLVAENGDNVIFQFTRDNSPLLSNKVLDIDIDQATGEVYIATDKGMIGFQGDATAGATNCDEILVYPNPVFTDYEGEIAIKGMAAGSTVKITTISGMLVREVQSEGGLATWNGRDIRGRKVRSGVYLALIADEDGEQDCIGKFVVIER